jgi:hypothetical protein
MNAITALRSMISEIERANDAVISGRNGCWPEVRRDIIKALANLLPDLSMIDAYLLYSVIRLEEETKEFISDDANNALDYAAYALNEFVLTGIAGGKRDALARLVSIREFHDEGAFEPDEMDRKAANQAVWDMRYGASSSARGETLREWAERIGLLEQNMAEAAE